MADSIRERIKDAVDHLTDQEVAELFSTLQHIKDRRNQPAYDESKDPMIGIFSGPTDLAERVEPRYTLDELVSKITPENRHRETDWGAAVGKEEW